MNITLSSDRETVEKTREFARRKGLSLNELIRRYMRSLNPREEIASVVEEFARNARAHGGKSARGFRFNREEAHRS